MGVVAIPPMVMLSRVLGKHQTLVLHCVVNALLLPLIFLLPRGEFLPAFLLFVGFGLNMSVGAFLFRAIMADVADHDHVETGQPRAGVYFALLALTNKLGYSCAILISMWTLAAIGFDGKGVNPPETIQSMMLLYVGPPFLISLVIAAVMWRFPLGETQHRELRRIIEDRATGTVIGEKIGHSLEDPADPEPSSATVATPRPAQA
jgi:Na+/melibiose symporter-like transporter